ncbi:TetR/AcrR family transcriptional regulator [Lipingzhangella sp. LS1_29]|uniref:TetR/AcrR family transcriptional regulator n=1 Tax=Lipingzhangella rawalii TaxID=2055835 RepID=A0ABU2HA22_9ACTN|nr:TetR/AcrR family transcriptional regulator [Lipingzhangella rawalii]MDS1272170.1 TetR/AcrR family transcriptional regulator [Lipingzhangella rawalii]
MTSRRNVEDRVLDAAHECVAAFGVRRTTLTDVARRAGVSRPTVYRRWPDVTSIVGDLLTRELGMLLDGCIAEAAAGCARERLVAGGVRLMVRVWEHPLFGRIIDMEPELLATYTFHRLGASQQAVLAVLGPEIAAGQQEGSIRDGDPDGLARMVLLVAQSTVLSWRLTTDVFDQDQLTTELRHLLDAYLRPETESP